jgi:hypothetical protein
MKNLPFYSSLPILAKEPFPFMCATALTYTYPPSRCDLRKQYLACQLIKICFNVIGVKIGDKYTFAFVRVDLYEI